jgi:hypothetical protein
MKRLAFWNWQIRNIFILIFVCGLLTTGLAIAQYSNSITMVDKDTPTQQVQQPVSGNQPAAATTTPAAPPEQPVSTSTQSNTPQPRPTSTNGGDYSVTKTCTDKVLPYKTVYKDTEGLYIGETEKRQSGVNGNEQTCVSVYTGKDWGAYLGKTYTTPGPITYPIDELIWRGTLQRPAAPLPMSYNEALYRAKNTCRPLPAGASVYDDCIRNELRKYGY